LEIGRDGFLELPIIYAHAVRVGTLPGEHRDPLDRMIAAMSIIQQLPVMTGDIEIQNLGAQIIW
jgi:PIN domain nuclease of toxin-antitoxin system